MKKVLSNKVSIIGDGAVGSTTAYTLMLSGLVSDIVIVDLNKNKAEGDVMDLNHGAQFVSPVKITAGEYKDCANSDIIIITAGAAQKPGETRIDLVKKNTAIFKTIIPELVRYSPEAIFLIVSNPVDILTYVTYKLSGLPSNRIIGSGTVLDTSRFKYLLSQHASVDARNIHTYIIGEHGDSEVPTWSLTTIAGMAIDEYCSQCCRSCNGMSKLSIYDDVKNAAYKIIEKKGATYYAVALAVNRIVESILRDEHSILTVSTLLNNQYGLNDIYLSLPSVVTQHGVDRVINVSLSKDEENKLVQSGKLMREILNELDI